jgi:hypothetical protein
MNLATMSTRTYIPRSPNNARFVCKYCNKVFSLEARFFRHKCKEMKRLEELQSPIGQAALGYYQHWLRQQKRLPPSASTFLTSRYFRTMVKFAEFVSKVKLPYPEKFIWLMVVKDLPPSLWTSYEVYSLYLEVIDKQTPNESVNMTINTLMEYAEKRDIDVSEIFEHIKGTELIDMLQKRQISPWLLLRSKKFKIYFRDNILGEQRIIVETFIRPEFWTEKLQKHSDSLPDIDKVVKELNL